jgi:hypothetical protein
LDILYLRPKEWGQADLGHDFFLVAKNKVYHEKLIIIIMDNND